MKPTTKQDICMTCHALVDWKFNESTRAWEAFEAGTKKLHRCVEGD